MTALRNVDRRTLLGLGAAGAGVLMLAGASGCGLHIGPQQCDLDKAGAAPGPDPSADPSTIDGRAVLATLADIPVGKAIVARDEGCGSVIIARPDEGTTVAFSMICPHKGVLVERGDDQWRCPAHGARFNLLTGAVEHGPATKPLVQVPVTVIDGKVVVAA